MNSILNIRRKDPYLHPLLHEGKALNWESQHDDRQIDQTRYLRPSVHPIDKTFSCAHSVYRQAKIKDAKQSAIISKKKKRNIAKERQPT